MVQEVDRKDVYFLRRAKKEGFVVMAVMTSSGRIAQSVERWSNKPLVVGSNSTVTIILLVAFLVEWLRVQKIATKNTDTDEPALFVAIQQKQKPAAPSDLSWKFKNAGVQTTA